MHFIVFKLNLNIVDIHVEFLKVCQPVWSLGREIPSLSQLGIGLATVNDLPPEGSSSAPPGGVPTAQIWLSLWPQSFSYGMLILLVLANQRELGQATYLGGPTEIQSDQFAVTDLGFQSQQ